MIPEIKRLLETSPFVAFTFGTSDGRAYAVPTADHATLSPTGTYMIVFFDDDSHAAISARHLVSAIVKTPA